MNRITDFVDSFIPKNISKKKAEILKDELTCHIMDKIDYYKELGYDEKVSVDKAIEDFGTNEGDTRLIYKEFEELYSERNIFAILAFVIVGAINLVCGGVGLWVVSADWHADPEPITGFISFCAIFVVLLMICYARIKKYRKSLFSIGVANILIAVSMIAAFYPQIAAFTIGYNILYLIDMFTPFSVGQILDTYGEDGFSMALYNVFLLAPAIYCFISSLRIKKGKAKDIEKPKKKLIIFSSIFFSVAIISCLIFPSSQRYLEEYSIWFECYDNCISVESETAYDSIAIGDSYADVSNYLKSEGYVTIEEYKSSLDRVKKKQFNHNLKSFDFAEGYEIWFAPEKCKEGNSFVGVKQENGTISAKAVGNLEERMYNDKYNYVYFGYTDIETLTDMNAVFDYFNSLKKGTSEEEVMSRFGAEYGFVYAKRCSVENGKEINYYRVYCYGETDPTEKNYFDKNDYRYIELTFEDGLLTEGIIYEIVKTEYSSEVKTERIG